MSGGQTHTPPCRATTYVAVRMGRGDLHHRHSLVGALRDRLPQQQRQRLGRGVAEDRGEQPAGRQPLSRGIQYPELIPESGDGQETIDLAQQRGFRLIEQRRGAGEGRILRGRDRRDGRGAEDVGENVRRLGLGAGVGARTHVEGLRKLLGGGIELRPEGVEALTVCGEQVRNRRRHLVLSGG